MGVIIFFAAFWLFLRGANFIKNVEKMHKPLDKGVFGVIYLHRQTSHKQLLSTMAYELLITSRAS